MDNSLLTHEKPNWKNLYLIGGVAALLQLAAVLSYTVALAVLGSKPASAQEYFTIQQTSRLASVLRGDFLLLFLLAPYLGTFPALYMALRRLSPVATLFATLFTLIAVTICFASESTFALLYLGERYAAATSEALRAQFLAAGEAVIASDMWNSSGAYMSGMLLQGGGVIISLVMLRSKDFSKVTAIAGLLGNALDLAQHLLHPFAPAISAPVQMLMGPFYLVWFPMLARDFFRLAKAQYKKSGEIVR
ncbi:MAG: DUF4386 family protein [Chloroflexota bacterium]